MTDTKRGSGCRQTNHMCRRANGNYQNCQVADDRLSREDAAGAQLRGERRFHRAIRQQRKPRAKILCAPYAAGIGRNDGERRVAQLRRLRS
ncbi:hypothetical protein PPGU19_092340 (plasmid) [Paraburkholderia sp. PGU19]|uniref:hypothetical protein n=1 Tax=Paraburkholderia sp. PGU19 TaxID=2735434 RepID=UPI0015DA7103|nr:hypothetical protein [Paraburkholderia sp. PGU19]BCG04666.1 hypothetical protein PPGU19_092340 [Paraburkholderia sp. PGU19]